MNWARSFYAALAAALLIGAFPAYAQETVTPDPNPTGMNIFQTIERPLDPQNLSTTMNIFILLTILSLAPAILVMTTSFTRVIVVLGFLRQAMATQQSPPNQVLIGLALFLTAFIMAPTYQRVYNEALQPYINGQVTAEDGKGPFQITTERALIPIREFMDRQTGRKDLALFINIAGLPRPNSLEDVPTHVLIPAFIISELKTAFTIGFLIYIPFLIIDMVVASTLMSMGMMMLPPVFVSLPFKIIMFVLADGWYLLTGELVRSFQ